MKRPTPRVGDLVCYNGAGMKQKSLGLVVGRVTDTANGLIRGYTTFLQIKWAVKPSISPRKEYGSPDCWNTPNKSDAWYRQGSWFEVYQPTTTRRDK